jgi:hypothetical protein
MAILCAAIQASPTVSPTPVAACPQKAGVESLTIPAYVFEAFGLPASPRNFNYSAMLFPDGKFVGHWTGNGPDASVPDLTQQEAQ